MHDTAAVASRRRRTRSLRCSRCHGAGRQPRPRRRRAARQTAAAAASTLPNKADSLKFAVLGDFGTGSRQQYELAAQMAHVHAALPVRAGHHWSATTSTGPSGRRTS